MSYAINNQLSSFMTDKNKFTMNNSKTPSWLFSFGAADIGYSSNKKGIVTYFFNQDDVSAIAAFTDRPNQLKGTTNMQKLSKNFKRMFGDDLPNASLTHWTDGNFYSGVFRIKSIKKRNKKYHIKTDSFLKDQITGAMGHDPVLIKMSALMEESAATKVISQASFYLNSSSGGLEYANCTQTQTFEMQNSGLDSGCESGDYFDTTTCSCKPAFIDFSSEIISD